MPNMRFSMAVAVLLPGTAILAAQSEPSGSPTWSNVPPADEFLRLTGGTVALLGDRVYYDGGLISQRGFQTYSRTRPMNTTLSIDLSRSWTTENVVINETPKSDGIGNWSYQHSWSDEEDRTFYTWGDGAMYIPDIETPPPTLWKFTAHGTNGSGTWSEVDVASEGDGIQSHTLDRRNGVTVSTPGVGFVFGGFSILDGSSNMSTGYSSFDYAAREWREHSDQEDSFSETGTMSTGAAVFVPVFGSDGLVFVLGGAEWLGQGVGHGNIGFERARFLDPVSKRWFSQNTTGDIPAPRARHCAVGVSGADGTYDIFIYGGRTENSGEPLTETSEIYVLSLPGFRWTRLYGDHDGEGRYDAQCALVGKRQLLSWGGTTLALDYSDDYGLADGTRSDSNANGLAVFDMSAGEWKTNYDAGAAAYEAHESVSAFHTREGLDKIEWSSEDVRTLFGSDNTEPQAPGTGGTGDEEAGADGSNGSNALVGAVPGGFVLVGALVAVGVAAVL